MAYNRYFSAATVMNKTALIIGYVWPEPNSSAAGSRMLQLIRALQDGGYQVHYASPAEFSEHAADLPTLGITPQRIALNCSSFDDYVQQLQPALEIGRASCRERV